MKKLKKLTSLLFLFCCLCFCLILFPQTARAGSLTPTAQDNLNVRLRRTSDLIPVSGGYMRVFHQKNSVGVEYYDNDLKIRSKRKINMELPLWGGFYAGSDGYYLVEGQTNNKENDSAEVIRVIRYDTNWNRNGAAAITSNPELFGGEVRTPFDYGCVEMTESNGKLYVVTGHEGYVDSSVGQGHQGFLMAEIDQATMKGKIVSCDLWHSFAQYIKSQGSYLYVLEQSEGSRCTKLSRYDSTTLACTTIELLPYGGSHTSVWALACYASVDGMAVSSDSVLCVGTSIDQSKYDKVSENTPHNLYLSVTPMSDFSEKATTTRKLTNFTGGGKSFAGVKITKINDNRFMISWEEYVSDDNKKNSSANDPLSSSTLHYLFVDGKGKSLSKEFMRNCWLSEYYQTRLHMCHVSTRGAIEAIQMAKLRGAPVTCEVTPHHLWFTNDTCDYRVNPPIRTADDEQALIDGIRSGVVDAIATDHAPRAAEPPDEHPPGGDPGPCQGTAGAGL